MAAPSNEKIVLDEDILRAQARTLGDAATTLQGTKLSGSVDSSAFGALCGALLAPAINAMAAQTRAHTAQAGLLAEAMGRAVTATTNAFATVESDAVDAFQKAEGEDG